MAFSDATTAALRSAGLEPESVEMLIATALVEDLGPGLDVTSQATIPADVRGSGVIASRQAGVVAGIPVAIAVFETLGITEVRPVVADGSKVAPGDAVIELTGQTRNLLTAERTALNLLCHLSGVATLTARWVGEVEGTGAAIRDTRKTTPGLRALEKYAVRCGGGVNHRMGLWDAALVKDNHVVAAGGVAEAFTLIKAAYGSTLEIEIECDTVLQVSEALAAGADLILLDNMTLTQLAEAVDLVDGRAKLEASGGLSLETARAVAETGVDYLAVGALTHSAPVLDLGLDLGKT